MQRLSRLLLILFVFAGFGVLGRPMVSAQTSGAAHAVDGFYSWYIARHGDWTQLSGARPYLSSSLYAPLQKVVNIERREQAAVLDFDPFSGAQAEAASYSVGSPVGSGSTASVPVRIRLSGGNGASALRVMVVHGSSGWKIDNIVYGNGTDLKRALQSALK